VATTDKRVLEGKVAAELHQIAADLGIEGHKGLKKADLVDRILSHTNGERSDAASVAAAAPEPSVASGDTTSSDATMSPTSGAYVDMRETSGNGDTRQRPQPDQRDQRQRDDRREGTRPQGGRPDAGQQQRDREGGARRRPSREERRRQRDEKHRDQNGYEDAQRSLGYRQPRRFGQGQRKPEHPLPEEQFAELSFSQCPSLRAPAWTTSCPSTRNPLVLTNQ